MHRLDTNSLTSKSIKLQQFSTLQFMATLQRTTTTNLITNNRNWNKWTNTLITMETNNRVLIIQTEVIKILLFTFGWMLTYFSLCCCHFLYLRFLFRFITSSTIFWVFARFSECLLSSSSCSPMVLVRCSITNRWAAWKGTLTSHEVTKQTFYTWELLFVP